MLGAYVHLHSNFLLAEYDRKGYFDADASFADWEEEEAEETQRQLFFRWEILERSLPKGSKCQVSRTLAFGTHCVSVFCMYETRISLMLATR